MRALLMAKVMGSTLLAGCGSSGGDTSGTIEFGTGYKGARNSFTLTGTASSFSAGSKIYILGHLSEPAGKTVRLVALSKQGDKESVVGEVDKDTTGSESLTTVLFPFDLRNDNVGTYEIRFEHGGTVIATGTFSIQ